MIDFLLDFDMCLSLPPVIGIPGLVKPRPFQFHPRLFLVSVNSWSNDHPFRDVWSVSFVASQTKTSLKSIFLTFWPFISLVHVATYDWFRSVRLILGLFWTLDPGIVPWIISFSRQSLLFGDTYPNCKGLLWPTWIDSFLVQQSSTYTHLSAVHDTLRIYHSHFI